MFFINRADFEMTVDNAVERAFEERIDVLADKAAKDAVAKEIEASVKSFIPEETKTIPVKLEQEMRNKVCVKLEEALSELYDRHETGNQYGDEKWWEQYPYNQTIGTEAFIDMLVDRINKKQIHMGL